MLRASWHKYRLRFTFRAITSRESMEVKDTYVIKVWDEREPEVAGWGECNLFRGLSADDKSDYELQLERMCQSGLEEVPDYSSLIFGAETALADLRNGGNQLPWPSEWTEGRAGIPINGLIWMGDKRTMQARIKGKIEEGYRCIKLKISGIAMEDELELLAEIRKQFSANELTIRLDANGAFAPSTAMERLKRLSAYGIHSIEQPIKACQYEEMARICRESPIPIALDEDLIGVFGDAEKKAILDLVRPQYIILKPALCGGFKHADAWIWAAESLGIGWWATSALESNIGLNAIAQWIGTKPISLPQGLGTGQLYDNNFKSPLRLSHGILSYDPNGKWDRLFNIIQGSI